MTIQLTDEESEKFFYLSLCNGLSYFAGYGIRLDYDGFEYEEARKNLIKKTGNESPCWEEVLMQILHDGKKLTFIDVEGDGENTKEITLQDIRDKVKNTPAQNLVDMATENDDAATADAILQTILYGDIIFG